MNFDRNSNALETRKQVIIREVCAQNINEEEAVTFFIERETSLYRNLNSFNRRTLS